MRPLIGITLDFEEEGSFSRRPYYALRVSYFDMIYKAGGLPVGIPYIASAIDEYLHTISGLIVPGGDYALQKDWYVDPDEEKPYPASRRLTFDIDITRRALAKDIPFLGICAGMQVLGGVLGAKMTPNVKKYLRTDIDHRNHRPAEEYAHDVKVEQGSLLHTITGKEVFSVNTAHTEALVEVPSCLFVSGVADDGVIEAIEVKDKTFALGVQWHPEFFLDEDDAGFQVIKALVEQARR